MDPERQELHVYASHRPGLRAFAVLAVLLVCVAATALARPAASHAAPATSSSVTAPLGCSVDLTTLGRERPPGCWRPYADTSPFNQPIPEGAATHPDSASIVSTMLGYGPLLNLLAGEAGTRRDWGRPTYFSMPTDPVFTVTCLKRWGPCDVEGHKVRIPDAARAAGGGDGHLSVVDPASGWEYDFWQVKSKPAGGGRLEVSWGGRTRIDGDGLGSDAVAVQTGTMAGVVRAEELAAGRIDHAVGIIVKCVSGEVVWPAAKPAHLCADIGVPAASPPASGQRLQLAMSEGEIDALVVPEWRKTVLRAMARYGMYVVDTGGSWGVVFESGVVNLSFGQEDEWVRFANSVGAPWWRTSWVLNLRDGVDWARDLRVVDPSVTRPPG